MNKDQQQQLWELVYGLLDEQEAAELREQIASDETLSQLFNDVKQQAQLLANAAKLETKPVSLHPPKDGGMSKRPWRNSRRLSWLVGLATSALVLLTLFFYARPGSAIRTSVATVTEREIANRFVRTRINGPSKLSHGIDNYYTVTTTSMDGSPVVSDVRCRLYDTRTGKLTFQHEQSTDQNGALLVALPPENIVPRTRLEIETVYEGETVGELDAHLSVADVQRETFVTTDKPLYRPGETVLFRSVTLSRFSHHNERELPVQFEIRDPAGTTISESRQAGVSENGVGNGSFTLDKNRPGGTYAVIATSPNDRFDEAVREFTVGDYRTPRLKKELELTRDSYAPGDEVIADFSAKRAEGGVVANGKLEVAAIVDGKAIEVSPSNPVSGTDGAYRIRFALPKEIEKGAASLSVAVDDGGTKETIAKTIPINLGKVKVKFYPEGGDLVVGLESRVYFHAVDPLGKPVHITGVVVDQNGDEVVEVQTHAKAEGRGSFLITPKESKEYQLEIQSPQVTNKVALPEANADRFVVLDSGGKVFESDKPIEIRVRRKKQSPLLIAAVCRGVHVGQSEIGDTEQVSIPISPRADGVIRLTAFDYSQSPPTPVAERLVYRRPARKLSVNFGDIKEKYIPGEHVTASLQLTDEKNRPVTGTLGVSVVDDAAINLADDKSPGFVTRFLLTGDIDNPQDLEDANFFLSENSEAAEALDLLLGTQGWRRFADIDLDKIAQSEIRDAIIAAINDDAPFQDKLGEIRPQATLASPPMVYDNTRMLRDEYRDSLAQFRHSRQSSIQTAGNISFFGALAIVLVLGVCALMRFAADRRVWIASLPAATACLILGGVWMGSRINHHGDLSYVTFAATPPTVDQANGVEKLFLADMDTLDDVEFFAWHDDGDMDGDADMNGDAVLLGINPRFREEVRYLNGVDKWRADRFWAFTPEVGRFAMNEHQLGLQLFEHDFDRGFGINGKWGKFRGKLFRYQVDGTSNTVLIGEQDYYGTFQKKLRYATDVGDLQQVEQLIQTYKAAIKPLQFRVREYAHQHVAPESPGVRSDFQETLFWHPLLITDKDGRAQIEFDLSDSVTSFRILADAHGRGRVGTAQDQVVSRLPFSIEPKLPIQVTAGDFIELPVAINNDSTDELSVNLTFKNDNDLFAIVGQPMRSLSLFGEQRGREHVQLDVVGTNGTAHVEVNAIAGQVSDRVKRSIEVVPPGFPVSQSYAGRVDGTYSFDVDMPETWVDGSLDVKLVAYPTALADLDRGIDGILREPSGCFEQTSSSNYPNVMALRYMQENDIADPAITRRAKDLLNKGYDKLVSFECPKQGYEWFGGDPGHEALTAYGLLEFRDMSQVWDVDQRMVERTSAWLLKRRDGKGGFQRNSRALDSFGSAPQQITDAYIVWALTEAGQNGIEKEVNHVIEFADASQDPYLIALAASVATNASHDRAELLLDKLVKLQNDDGHLVGTSGSITRSGGISLEVETTALAALAWLKNEKYGAYATKALDWIAKNRQGSGSFGSTQATILALKALVEHANANRSQLTDGDLIVKMDGKEVGRRSFVSDVRQAIEIGGIAKSLKSGENKIAVELTDENKMSFSLDVSYRTRRPASSECPLRLSTRLAKNEIKSGEVVPVHVELANEKKEGLPMAVAIIGLPAGLEVRPKQLEELKEAGKFDYFETEPREVICYWRGVAPNAAIEFDLDLIAAIPGKYEGPASRTYLYYTAEEKHWVDPIKVTIKP